MFDGVIGSVTMPDPVADLFGSISQVWNLRVLDSGGHPLTVGSFVVMGIGVVVALVFARWASEWCSRTATRSFGMGASQAEVVGKAVFCCLTALLVVTTLSWLSIPLTAFAFLGGALAIGIGFGAQNLMNNFISGIILLTERQVRVGDIIEVGGSTGTIVHLGTRCSRLRKFDGVEVLIPNSAFLEKDVTNWTLNDPHHRFDFTVGVAYGSPVEKVIAVLDTAVREEPGVLESPAPGVFFESFGDSALVFRIYFWIEVGGPSDVRMVGSNIRRRIDREFREAGIEMPFPQRDLRIRGSAAIPVRIEK
jgi:small-conductance mechanosensitive channel